MEINREFVMEFITKFKQLPCLWQITNKYYRNKRKKAKAFGELLEIYRTKHPDATIDTVRRKIQTLRSCFRKENNKIKKSQLAGEEVHVPKLWYFEHLLFLRDLENPSATSNNQSILSDPFEDIDEAENCDFDAIEINAISLSSEGSISQPSTSRASSVIAGYKRSQVHTDAILSKISKRLDDSKPSSYHRQRYAAFGEHVAEKLRSLPENMAIYCQKIINDAIYMADLGNLNETSHIVTQYLKCE